ncbi:MAG TPA: 5-(carboxyamino)imidazole ribonucleotide mutase [Acidimicrobiaceae bacterium]|nr:5-(carboxyamino)imidazole ribonucleotide mutase [Actinomycetota bacterium]HAQ03740.1 5-(carboxyamino)imidazole ribonucleotide mutase [Acidimicrobiaceae bacterium]
MGSPSDSERMKPATEILEKFGVDVDTRVMSAHRTPGNVADFASQAVESGFSVIICGAGMAAHLAGAVAANTILPVIGVPLSGSAVSGFDSLLATVQMPKGIPVATVAIDGAMNAGLLAIQMLALNEPKYVKLLESHRDEMASR